MAIVNGLSSGAGKPGSLSENESRKVLEEYGIPMAVAKLTTTSREAIDAADEIGYPVVLKGCGADLTHKSEAGIVKLNLRTSSDVTSAFRAIQTATGGVLDGVLVQEQVHGVRELVAGMIRDPQFGPCVMFGLGGILTEALDDVSFRIAPVERRDAMAMMDEIRSAAILGPIRGMAAADRSVLSKTLLALGRIGLEHEEIEAIDINPLLLQEDGTPVAVDAAIWISRRNLGQSSG